jgi:hypothetical protein
VGPRESCLSRPHAQLKWMGKRLSSGTTQAWAQFCPLALDTDTSHFTPKPCLLTPAGVLVIVL